MVLNVTSPISPPPVQAALETSFPPMSQTELLVFAFARCRLLVG